MAEEEALKYGGPIGDVIHPLPTKAWWFLSMGTILKAVKTAASGVLGGSYFEITV